MATLGRYSAWYAPLGRGLQPTYEGAGAISVPVVIRLQPIWAFAASTGIWSASLASRWGHIRKTKGLGGAIVNKIGFEQRIALWLDSAKQTHSQANGLKTTE
jgi:hypothetical protein